MSNFHQREVVGSGGDTQLQVVAENLNKLTWREKGYNKTAVTAV